MPATTTLRPATDAQKAFIRTLVAERNPAALAATGIHQEVAAALAGTPVRRDLINRLLQIPRAAAPGGSPWGREAELVPTPSDATRAGRMLNSGGIEATVTLATGEHVTIRIRTRQRVGRGWGNAGVTDEGARTNIQVLGQKVGWINVDDGAWTVTFRTRSDNVKAAVRELFEYASGVLRGPDALRVQEASRCGRCFRTLTDPVSIDRGIGPECIGHVTGSRHASIEAHREGARSQARGERFHAAAADAASQLALVAEAEHDAAFAAREREQETAAFLSDPDYQRDLAGELARLAPRPLSELAASLVPQAPAPDARDDVTRARDIIIEALDSYSSEEDMDFALRIFNQLARTGR